MSAAATIFFTPAVGNSVLIYDGSNMNPTTFTELSQALTDTTKSPAATTANNNYDMFVWNDGGTIRCTRGPAWSSATVRGAGTTLVTVNGVMLNNASITNGPAASRGTYVGTIRTNASNKVELRFEPAAASGGTSIVMGVWNAYNQIPLHFINYDSTATWTLTTTTAPQARNGNSAGAFIGLLQGLDYCVVRVSETMCAQDSNTNAIGIGLAVDGGSPLAWGIIATQVLNKASSCQVETMSRQAAGYHTWFALEGRLGGSGTTTFNNSTSVADSTTVCPFIAEIMG